MSKNGAARRSRAPPRKDGEPDVYSRLYAGAKQKQRKQRLREKQKEPDLKKRAARKHRKAQAACPIGTDPPAPLPPSPTSSYATRSGRHPRAATTTCFLCLRGGFRPTARFPRRARRPLRRASCCRAPGTRTASAAGALPA